MTVTDAQALAGTGISSIDISEVLPDGGVLKPPTALGFGYLPSRQQFTDPSAQEVTQRIQSAAAQFGLSVVNVRVLRAYTAAPMVILRTSDPSANGPLPQWQEIIRALFGGPPGIPLYEGYFIEVQNTQGRPLVRASASFRTGAGRTWNDPSVHVGIAHGGPPRAVGATAAGVQGVRWHSRRGVLDGLVIRVTVGRPGTVILTVRARGKVIGRSRHRFGAPGRARVFLGARGPIAATTYRGRFPVDLSVTALDAQSRPYTLRQLIRPAGPRPE